MKSIDKSIPKIPTDWFEADNPIEVIVDTIETHWPESPEFSEKPDREEISEVLEDKYPYVIYCRSCGFFTLRKIKSKLVKQALDYQCSNCGGQLMSRTVYGESIGEGGVVLAIIDALAETEEV